MTGLGYFVPEFPGQTHAFFWREVQAMREAGARVVLFSSRRPSDDACPHDFARRARSETAYVFPPDPLGVLRLIATRPGRVARCIRYCAGLTESRPAERLRVTAMIASAADLVRRCADAGIGHVHFHSCASSAHIGALARILGDISYSVTVHGDLPVYGTDHASKFAGASVVTAVTRPLADEVGAVWPGRPVPVIPMGVDVELFAPRPETPREAGPLVFVTVARLNRAKGHSLFLEALRRLVDAGLDARYVVVGEGPDRDAIAARIAALGLGDRVSLPGAVAQQALPDLLRAADVFVLPSVGLGEAAPVSVMEAMACGRPVICSVIGGTADMIEHEVDGFLVPQGGVDEIVAAAQRLAADPGLRRRIGEAARAKALGRFDYRVKARELLAALHAAQAGAKAGRPDEARLAAPAR